MLSKVTRPSEMMDSRILRINALISQFETRLDHEEKNKLAYSLTIHIKATDEEMKEICKLYKDAGWTDVRYTYDEDRNTILTLYR